jgi:hypothetical protein
VRLFILEADRVMSVWEYSFVTINPNAMPPHPKYDGKWSKMEDLGAEFFEPFRIFIGQDGPVAVTDSGQLYMLPKKQEAGARPVFQKHGTGGVVLLIEDSATNQAYAFTKSACFSLDKPDMAQPFDLPGLGEEVESTAKTLVTAAQFLSRM